MKAIVIGRHNGEIPGIEVIENRNITFPATSAECKPVFEALLDESFEKKVALIFQALPGQMVATITSNIGRGGPITQVPVGIVVSKTGQRPAGVEYKFDHDLFDRTYKDDVHCAEVERLAKHCNPNAKVNGFTVTVDPPMQFVFSHIEWLNGG